MPVSHVVFYTLLIVIILFSTVSSRFLVIVLFSLAFFALGLVVWSSAPDYWLSFFSTVCFCP